MSPSPWILTLSPSPASTFKLPPNYNLTYIRSPQPAPNLIVYHNAAPFKLDGTSAARSVTTSAY